jgi:hypothetical protein
MVRGAPSTPRVSARSESAADPIRVKSFRFACIWFVVAGCVAAADDPQASVLPIASTPPSCPAPAYGVVSCDTLAPECQGPVDPATESGLHCLPGYADDPSVPCFCVGAASADSWCMRSH